MRSKTTLIGVVAAVAAGLLTASTAGAGPKTTPVAGLMKRMCTATAHARAPHGVAAQASPARSSALQLYDDAILDVVSAPDICQSNLVTNDNRAISVGIHIHDRSGFAAPDTYEVLLDTDANPATGAPAETGPTAGAEYVIGITEGRSSLSAWNGTAFVLVTPQPEIPTGWLPDFGPALQIDRTALGSPQAMNLVVRTVSGTDIDLAPDTGTWPYAVTPLRLTVEFFGTTTARAGNPFGVAMEVTRSDFDIALDEGTIACNATIAGKKLAGRGRFVTDLATCSWRLPKKARGKRVRGSISVTFQEVIAKRSFARTVR